MRALHRLSVGKRDADVVVTAVANAFLHQMVRSLVGVLVAVGEGRIDPDAIEDVLAARNRAAAGRVAPPQGLALMRVIYRPGRSLTAPQAHI